MVAMLDQGKFQCDVSYTWDFQTGLMFPNSRSYTNRAVIQISEKTITQSNSKLGTMHAQISKYLTMMIPCSGQAPLLSVQLVALIWPYLVLPVSSAHLVF